MQNGRVWLSEKCLVRQCYQCDRLVQRGRWMVPRCRCVCHVARRWSAAQRTWRAVEEARAALATGANDNATPAASSG